MKRIYLSLLSLFVLATCSSFFFKSEAQEKDSLAVSPNFVISQFKVAGATATDEFVEIHNTSSSAVDLNGYNLVYRSAAGTNDVSMVAWTTSTIVPAGGYYLVATSTYTGSVPSNTNYNTATVSMSATGGGLAMRNGALNTGVIVDSVGYGTATNAFVEGTVTTAPAVNTSQSRANNGCQDTDVNSADFANTNPSAPRNASSPVVTCSGGGGGNNILANGGASPSTVSPNGTTLLTVNVFPATTPPSTGITVTANLSNVFGPASQQFFDNGTNGDVLAGDNIFSYSYTVPGTATGGTFGISAVVSDAEARTANVNFNLTISAATAGENPLLLGNPSNAVADINSPFNYLMEKPQYSLSYHRDRKIPNWVAWRLDSTWIGSAPRQDDYRPDPALPSGWYQVQDNDYSGQGYDRGHMCPSGDRTRSIPDNSATFLMTNFVPQLSANNQGPWEDFETYLRSLASGGNEIYIYTGSIGSLGTTNNAAQVTIPQYTWKVALVLPNGNNDLQRVTKNTRTIAILVPNFTGTGLQIGDVWREWRTTVKKIEALTGYQFFTNVPANTRNILVRKRDLQ